MSNRRLVSNRSLWQKDRDHFVHPWTMFDTFQDEGALIISSGTQSYLFDPDGKKYIDAVGGLWCNNIGLGREEMVEAIAAQARKMAFASPFVDMTNEPAAELAAKLANLAPGDLNHVFFTTGGSTAVDTAFRLSHFYQSCRGKREKRHILSRVGAYHGSTYASMSIGGKQGDRVPEFEYISDIIHHLSCPYYYRAPKGLTEAEFCDQLIDEFERKILEIGADNVSAYFAEPILGAGGVIVPPEGYIQRTHALCRKYDILYVSDEVVTAFGRLGHWFASKDVFGIEPDIIITAKGLTSGYQPLGACIFNDKIYDVIAEKDKGRCFATGYTYSGHPVCTAAALKNIEIMEREQLFEHVHRVGPYFQEQLNTLRDLPIVGDVRGKHLMACIEFVADQESKELFPEDLNIGKLISNAAEAHGLIVRPIVHLNVMSPPLIITTDEVDLIVHTLRQSIEETIAQLRDDGVM